MRKQNRVLPISMVIVIAGILALQSCGSGSLFGSSGVTRSPGGFALTALPDPSMPAHSARTLRMEPVQAADPASAVSLRINITDARACKAAFFKLDYDSARFTPIAVEAGPALRGIAAPGQLLELSVLDQPGTLYHGQCLAGWEELAGCSGDGLLATVRFARRPFAAQARAVSTPPDSALSQTTLAWDEPSAKLSWRFYNQGDYNQDGEVGINDLTPLGLYFAQTCSYPADENTARACADGDHNGELNISDITPIGNNFGRDMLNGWVVWSCSDVAQYPTSAADDNGTATAQGSVALAGFDPSTTRAADRVLYTCTVSTPVAGDVYWVRPMDQFSTNGIASNYAPGGGTTNHAPVISALDFSANPVSSGGTSIMLVQATDADGDTLSFSLGAAGGVSAGDGDSRPESFIFCFPTVATDTIYGVAGFVDDGHGGTDSLAQDILVLAPVAGNSPPTITSVTATPSTIPSGGTSSAASTAVDIDGDILGYTWMPDSGLGYFEGSGSAVTYHAPTVSSDTAVMVYLYVDDGHGHSVTDTSLTINVTAGGANVPPTAYLTGSPSNGPAPLSVDLDASGSSDTDGTIVTYDWDWDGDGTYDSLNGAATQTRVYDTPGSYTTIVRVTDDDSATGTDGVGIQVNPPGPTWHVSLISRTYEIGRFSSLADVDGAPAMSFWDTTAGNLLYVRANDGLGASWPPPSDVDNSGLVGNIATDGNFTSLKVVAGHPAIAYYREQKLFYMRALDAQGSSWITPFSLDGDVSNDVGECASMAIIHSNPAIAYYDRTNGDLKFIRCNDEYGSVWPNPAVTVDTTHDSGWSICLAQVAGKPMISYQDRTTYQLLVASSINQDGIAGSWGVCMPTSDSSAGDTYTSLIDLGGLPAVAYALNSSVLYFSRATDASLTSWTTPLQVAPGDVSNGTYCSMTLYDGAPAISYGRLSLTNGLSFVTAADANGDSWNARQDVDAPSPPESVGAYTSMVLIGGNPAISYYDAYYGDLKFAMLY